MTHTRWQIVSAVAAAVALTLVGCTSSTSTGSGPSDLSAHSTSPAGGSQSMDPSRGENSGESAGENSGDRSPDDATSTRDAHGVGRSITVWYMYGDYSEKTLHAAAEQFTEQTGAGVNFEQQQWDGIGATITDALATDTPPDVLDLGNTQVASYAVDGGLLDLTDHREDMQQGQQWLAGLEDPATVNDHLYAIPGFAGARAVIYNKTMWAQAGVTKPPRTYDEFVDDLAAVADAHADEPDFSPIYLPGQYWYVGLQFVWDAGGVIATETDGVWQAALSSPEARQGLADFKDFQNRFSTEASRGLNTDDPSQAEVFADLKTSAIVATNGFLSLIQDANPDITDADLGSFAFPGRSGDKQPVMLGGSDWGIAARSSNQDLALTFVKIATSPYIQNQWVFNYEKWIPNSDEGARVATDTVPGLQKAFFTAALNSNATPASPNWAKIEQSKDINTLFSSIADGSMTVDEAAAEFDAKADAVLNGDGS